MYTNIYIQKNSECNYLDIDIVYRSSMVYFRTNKKRSGMRFLVETISSFFILFYHSVP